MLTDKIISSAVSKIIQRSEKQQDAEKLIESFVDSGICEQLDNNNNQILFGRRGTGKTHIFLYLKRLWDEKQQFVAPYIDVRTLSSTQSIIGDTVDKHHYTVSLIRDLLQVIHGDLMEYITDPENDLDNAVLELLDHFGKAITEFSTYPVKKSSATTSESQYKDFSKGAIGGGITATGVSLKGTLSEGKENLERQKEADSYDYIISDSLPFSTVYKTLDHVIASTKIEHIYLLIDEWVAVPLEFQPAVAECIKRIFLPNPKISIKIASIQYRSHFITQCGNKTIGVELGSDVSAALDLDYYYVYDKNPERIQSLFAKVLFRHLNAELPASYLSETYGIKRAEELPSRIFSETKSFLELVRASEGVIRDYINIFSMAFFNSKHQGGKKIHIKSITDAAQRWFQQDKYSNLRPELLKALETIISDVIGVKKARSFLIRSNINHSIIQELFDLRLIHLISEGISDKTNPGIRYNVFTLDYGTYVDLLKTNAAPEVEMKNIEEGEEQDRVVPFDDKRSIRRIILDPAIFN